jgi:hypothetical protein
MPASSKTAIMVAVQPDTAPVPQPYEYKPLPKPPSNPVARYGVASLTSPAQILVKLERWATEQARREGGDKPNENWISYGYTLPEMQAVSIALSQALSESLSLSKGKLRTV